MKKEKIKISAERIRDYIKSPECLFAYLWNIWRKQKRRIFIDKYYYAYVECPSRKEHGVTQSCLPHSFMSAQLVRERKTGKGYLHCDICGGTWDLMEIFAIDHWITRADAIREIETALQSNFEIVAGVQFENVKDIHDMGARDTRLTMDCDGIHLCTIREYCEEFERREKDERAKKEGKKE